MSLARPLTSRDYRVEPDKKTGKWIVRAPWGAPVSAISHHDAQGHARYVSACLNAGMKLENILPRLTRKQ
jgi:hypothetical protein